MATHKVMVSSMLQSVRHRAPQDPTVPVPLMSTESAMEENDLVGVKSLLNGESLVSETIWWVFKECCKVWWRCHLKQYMVRI